MGFKKIEKDAQACRLVSVTRIDRYDATTVTDGVVEQDVQLPGRDILLGRMIGQPCDPHSADRRCVQHDAVVGGKIPCHLDATLARVSREPPFSRTFLRLVYEAIEALKIFRRLRPPGLFQIAGRGANE